MRRKYVVFENDRGNAVMLFSEQVSHREAFGAMRGSDLQTNRHGVWHRPVGAGFFRLVASYDENDPVKVEVFDESETLNMGCRPEDAGIIAQFIGLGYPT